MSYTTNVTPLELTEDGVVLPEEGEILSGVIQDLQSAFGTNLKFYDENNKLLLSTPQGQLASSMAAIISDRNRLFAYYVNQINPNYALGRMQDAIGQIYFIDRRPATYTEVVGLCKGRANVTIQKGTPVIDTSNNIYTAKDDYTIGDDGLVNVTFICNKLGSIECAANSLSLYQTIPGWDSVTNPNAGIIGRSVESQQQFEQRRRQSVAINSTNSIDSIMANLLTLTDNNDDPICQDVYVTENSTSSETVNGTVTLKPHSIYVCVAALSSPENNQSIAKTIWSKKPPGCDMTGNTTVTITDNQVDENGKALYSSPPSYDIIYSYAQGTPIFFKIVMNSSPDQPNNAEALIKEAVVSSFNGDDGSSRPRIGSTILASVFYSTIYSLGSWARVVSIEVGKGSDYSNSVTVGINEVPTLSINNIEVDYNGE